MTDNRNKFIFFESWDKYLDILEEDKDVNYANAVARAIIKYGLYGDCQTDDKSIERRVNAVCADLIDSVKTRYTSAVTGGIQGGRPMRYDQKTICELRDAGMSLAEIAEKLGCSKKTVQRALSEEKI